MSIILCCVSVLASLSRFAAGTQEPPDCILIATALPSKFALEEEERVAEVFGEPLQLVNVNSELEYAAVICFVSRAFPSPEYHPAGMHRGGGNCSKVIGVVGDIGSRTARIIHTLASRSNQNVILIASVAPSTLLPVSNLALPNLLDMEPLSHYIDALVSFLDHLNWTRVGLITDNTYYYQFAAELLQRRLLQDPKNTVIPFVRITDNVLLPVFQEYKTQIIVILMDEKTACLILQEAQKLNFKWPEYSLITLDFETSDSIRFCDWAHYEALIIVNEDASASSPERGENHSISAILPALSSNFSFPSGDDSIKIRDNKRLRNISFIQLVNSSRLEIACYNSESQQLVLLPNTSLTSGITPRGSTLVVEYIPSVAHNVCVVMSIIFCTALVLIVFILYVCFHKEPEIKATSVTVSLCMFLGCCLLLLYLPVLLINAQPVSRLPYPGWLICNLLTWLSLLGLPLTLILATLFVKMLRVYLIFCTPHSYKRKLFSNPFLFLYIILLTSPSFFLLLLWSATDTFTDTPLKVHEKSHLVQFERCLSSNTFIWLGLQLVYVTILTIALVIVAFKSSKIRFENFKDTKETNAFAFVTIFITMVGLMYFYLFYGGEASFFNTVAEKVILYIVHIIILVTCQAFLFVPKVYPPIKRHFAKNAVQQK